MSRRAVVLVGIALVIAAALLASRSLELGPRAPAAPSDARIQTPASSGGDRRSPFGRRPIRTPAPPADAAVASTDAGPPRRFKLSGLFTGGCNFGVRGHCAEWNERARRCDTGDADACVLLGDLLIGEAPAQPLWGSLFLERACELGRDDACERGVRWNRWSRYGYSPAGIDAGELPGDLAGACAEGDQVACGLIEMRRARTGGLDVDRALDACRWGFRDVCGVIFEAAPRTAQVIAALEIGCESPDAWLCYHLSRMYAPGCADLERRAPCPPADPVKAARYSKLACRLDPDLDPCRAK